MPKGKKKISLLPFFSFKFIAKLNWEHFSHWIQRPVLFFFKERLGSTLGFNGFLWCPCSTSLSSFMKFNFCVILQINRQLQRKTNGGNNAYTTALAVCGLLSCCNDTHHKGKLLLKLFPHNAYVPFRLLPFSVFHTL